MTMTPSYLSNINIPAGSLFSPGAKPLFHFESSLWRLETFPWYFFPSARLFACIQVTSQPVTSSTGCLISPEQRSKQLSGERWVHVSSTKRLPRDGYSVSRGRDRGFDICISQQCIKLECKREKSTPQKIDFFSYFCIKWNPSGLRQGTVRLITSVQIKFCDFTWLTKKIWVPKVIFHCHLEPPKCKFNLTNCLFFSADVPHS